MSEAINFSDIWSMSSDVINKNNEAKQEIHADIPGEDKVASNINGYIVNVHGNIVAKFGFFIEAEDESVFDIKISTDGFLAKIYHAPTNVIVGYGHPLGFTGLIDIEKSQILHLSPEAANGEDILIKVDNDDLLREQGLVIIMRAEDVMIDLLAPDVQDDFKTSLLEAETPATDLNEIEASYNSYIKHIYVTLCEANNGDVTVVEEVAVYE